MTEKNWKYRAFEILPGALVWTTLIASVVLSFIRPLWVVYFVIVFDLYWLFRVTYSIPFILISWYRFQRASRTDWQKLAVTKPGYDRIRHVVFLPTYKEDIGVIRGTLNSILASAFPSDRMIIVLAGRSGMLKDSMLRPRNCSENTPESFFVYLQPFIRKICRKKFPGKDQT